MKYLQNLTGTLMVTALLSACTYQLGGGKPPPLSIAYGKIEKITPAANAAAGSEPGGYDGMVQLVGRGLAPADQRAANVRKAKRLAKLSSLYVYEIKRLDGKTVRIRTEKSFLERKDCVAIERTGSINLRRVDDSVCLNRPTTPLPRHQISATQCSLAKNQLVLAQTDQQVQRAQQQVETLCQFK